MSRTKIDYNVTNLVFVYGSLKNDKWNNRFLATSDYLGECVTEDRYWLGDVGFPYAFPQFLLPSYLEHKAKPVLGEVWIVDSLESFAYIDMLEGYPRHYYRHVINTDYGRAWMYVNPDVEDIQHCSTCSVIYYHGEEVYQWQ